MALPCFKSSKKSLQGDGWKGVFHTSETKVVANDQQVRRALCKYILRPPLVNDRLTLIDDDHVRLDFLEVSSLLAGAQA